MNVLITSAKSLEVQRTVHDDGVCWTTIIILQDNDTKVEVTLFHNQALQLELQHQLISTEEPANG